MSTITLRLKYKHDSSTVALPADSTIAAALAAATALTEIGAERLKLIHRGRVLKPPEAPLASLGLAAAAAAYDVMVVGSAAAEVEQQARAEQRHAGRAEARDRARKQARLAGPRGRGGSTTLADVASGFTRVEALRPGSVLFGKDGADGVQREEYRRPPPQQAQAMLERLAADRGIAAVMARESWSVGLLAEIPPSDEYGNQVLLKIYVYC